MPIKFACTSCGKAYNVKDELAGKKAKCKCGNVMQVPAAAAAAPVEIDPLFADDPLGGDLFGGDLFGDATNSATAAPASNSLFDEAFPAGGTLPAAPTSYQASPYQAASHQAAPYQTASHQAASHQAASHQAASHQAASHQAAPQQSNAAPAGNPYAVAIPTVGPIEDSQPEETPMATGIALLIGVTVCGAGSMLGALIWLLIALVTGLEIGWIAWGVGFTSGFGMAIAHHLSDGIDDFLGGVIAGTMAVFGILAGKYAVYLVVVLPMIREMGDAAELLTGGVGFGIMFGPMDGLFFFLAVATAYKLGSGTFGDDD